MEFNSIFIRVKIIPNCKRNSQFGLRSYLVTFKVLRGIRSGKSCATIFNCARFDIY